jgi:hypothetical protein
MISILKDNEVYRVFDLLQRSEKDELVMELLSNPKYENTILRRYFEQVGNPTGDRDIPKLLDIIKQWASDHKLAPYNDDYVLVHVRSGDEIKRRGLLNPVNVEFYKKELANYPDKKVVIVTALHYGHMNTGSKLYRSTKNSYSKESEETNKKVLKDFIDSIPQEVSVMSHSNVDIDLCHLALCKNLIATPNAGGFATIILELNANNK